MKPIYVICFYWQGDRWKNNSAPSPLYNNLINRVGKCDLELAAKYVNNLYLGVKKNTTLPFKFICFTNEDLILNENIETRSLTMATNKGVLPRLYMFSEAAGLFDHQVLCLDIDILITGNLDEIMSYDGLFCARSKFLPGQEYKLDGDIMSFKAGKVTEKIFWTPFIEDPVKAEEETQGRERYWMRKVADDFADRWDKVTPNAVVSYKQNVLRNGLKKENKIVSCHGYPRPHQIKHSWIKQYWK